MTQHIFVITQILLCSGRKPCKLFLLIIRVCSKKAGITRAKDKVHLSYKALFHQVQYMHPSKKKCLLDYFFCFFFVVLGKGGDSRNQGGKGKGKRQGKE